MRYRNARETNPRFIDFLVIVEPPRQWGEVTWPNKAGSRFSVAIGQGALTQPNAASLLRPGINRPHYLTSRRLPFPLPPQHPSSSIDLNQWRTPRVKSIGALWVLMNIFLAKFMILQLLEKHNLFKILQYTLRLKILAKPHILDVFCHTNSLL